MKTEIGNMQIRFSRALREPKVTSGAGTPAKGKYDTRTFGRIYLIK
jgi:hypothetical protein